MEKTKITALYERISKDDGEDNESNSVKNQKELLDNYAKSRGFRNIVHFTDDGVSGTRFGSDRPGLAAMMAEIENGNVAACLCKDVSRLGRDYLQVGLCMERMRVAGTRLIAVNDGLDTINGEDDFTPFRNVLHEFYARDTSRKLKSSFRTKGMSGRKMTGTVAYGYLWDEGRENWVVDDEAAEVVRRIFRMTIDGMGPYQIARKLAEEGIPIPSVHLARHGEGVNQNKEFKNPTAWGASTIVHMLKRREYLGHTVNFKTAKHFKDKKSHYVDESEWVIFENTHEPVIDPDTFDTVQRIRGNARRYPDGWGEAHPLTGLLRCADCGGKMYVHRNNNGKRIPYFTCANYSKTPAGELCPTAHRVKAEAVTALIADTLRAVADYSSDDRDGFIKAVTDAHEDRANGDIARKKRRLAALSKRSGELEKLVCRIYEDHVLGKLPGDRYAALDGQYAKEQETVAREIREIGAAIADHDRTRKSADRFIALVEKYENFDTPTPAMLNEFVDKILVHERARKGVRDTDQQIDIHFNFVGQYVPPRSGEEVPTPEEIEDRRKKEERRERLHRNYLKRKENGKAAEYYEKTKAKKKAAMDAMKNEIREEDMANGVFARIADLPKAGTPAAGKMTA